MGTLCGILFLIGLFIVGKQIISEGFDSASESLSGNIFAVIMVFVGIGLISMGYGTLVGMIFVAFIAIAISSSK